MYDIHDYGVMINDSVRVDAYLRSLESIISCEMLSKLMKNCKINKQT